MRSDCRLTAAGLYVPIKPGRAVRRVGAGGGRTPALMNLQASWPRTWPTIWLSEQVQSALGLGVSFGRDLE